MIQIIIKSKKNIKDGIDESNLYELDKLSLGDSHKEWLNHGFGIELKNIHDMKSLNYMNGIHENKVNNMSEWILLHDILNLYKHTKNINIHYSHILHGCIYTRRVRVKYKIFQILLDIGCSSTIIIRRLTMKLKTKKYPMIQYHTQVGNLITNHKVKIYFTLPEFRATK